MLSGLDKRVALVTGGAGGIGKAICVALAEAGANVIVGYNRSGDAARSLAGALPEVAGGHMAAQAQVTSSRSLEELHRNIEQRFARVDIVVNCAGMTRFVAHSDLDGLDDKLIDEILATNVRGPFAVVRAMLPLLRKSEHAVVVNISSIASVTANGSNVIYCASKAALDNMTKSLARALAPTIRVLAVAPGLVDTEFIANLDEQWRNEQVARTPLKSLATPRHVAEAVVAATRLSSTTGAVIPVDGGRPLA
ncbi:MAG: 3-oxoacyl-[acyl-carrier-protein] reductase FabG [Burkholderiaceae bacterium]|nr:3-oxoacyl-[acyl-carrier-protein] reductase FabG [Burkholderiaceae bacterium]